MTTKIEWVKNQDGTKGETWNPISGCSLCSPGCDHCYAKRMAQRLKGRYGYPEDDPFKVTFHPDKINSNMFSPDKKVFVCSMSDIFHRDVKPEWLHDIWSVMKSHRDTTFILLTKRPEFAPKDETWWFPNIWVGCSVCNQAERWKIDEVRKIPATVKFISFEPLLEDMGKIDFDGIGWTIVGGEAGPKARPMKPEWPRALRDQCVSVGVPYFFKQWGEWCWPEQMPDDTYREIDAQCGQTMGVEDKPYRVSKKKAGRLLDGKIWDQYPNKKHAVVI